MAFKLSHTHFRTPDPDATVKWYVDTLGAKVVAHDPAKGSRVDLHGMPRKITAFRSDQTHKQNYGFEHIAVRTDDVVGTVAKLKACGSKMLEEVNLKGGRKIYFFEGPQGVILELIEEKAS